MNILFTVTEYKLQKLVRNIKLARDWTRNKMHPFPGSIVKLLFSLFFFSHALLGCTGSEPSGEGGGGRFG